MQVTVRYFAAYRERTGLSTETREAPPGTSVGSLLQSIVAHYPALSEVARASRCVVNQEYVPAETELHDGDEVTFIPPVSGGDLFEVTEEPLTVEPAVVAVADERAGCTVVFVGSARRFSRGKTVEYLEYEAYPEMAEKKLREIGAEIQERWDVAKVAIRHRVGHLGIGEASIVIAVSAPHRAEGFEACRYAIDRIKQIVPVWKKEVWDDGEVWVGMEGG